MIRILSQKLYCGFGPTLASEYLEKKHEVKIGREALRQMMIGAGLWRSRTHTTETVPQWRARRLPGGTGAVGHQRTRLAIGQHRNHPRAKRVLDANHETTYQYDFSEYKPLASLEDSKLRRRLSASLGLPCLVRQTVKTLCTVR